MNGTDDRSRIEVIVVRLEGQIASLRTEVQALKEAAMARVESSERQSQQSFTLVDERLKTLGRRLDDAEKRDNEQESRLTALNQWRSQMIGIAIGSALAGGGTAGLIIRALGS